MGVVRAAAGYPVAFPHSSSSFSSQPLSILHPLVSLSPLHKQHDNSSPQGRGSCGRCLTYRPLYRISGTAPYGRAGHFCFTVEETEAQRGARPHEGQGVEPDSNPDQRVPPGCTHCSAAPVPDPPPPYLPPTGMWELRLVEHPWLSRLRLQAAGALDQAHPQPAVLPGGDCPTPSPGASPRRKEGAADCQGWEGI